MPRQCDVDLSLETRVLVRFSQRKRTTVSVVHEGTYRISTLPSHMVCGAVYEKPLLLHLISDLTHCRLDIVATVIRQRRTHKVVWNSQGQKRTQDK